MGLLLSFTDGCSLAPPLGSLPESVGSALGVAVALVEGSEVGLGAGSSVGVGSAEGSDVLGDSPP